MKGMSTMIKIRIRNADHEIDVQFPISENELYAKLAEIHAIEGKEAPQSAFVTEVYWPEEFSMLKDRLANLDELNYLGKRMESFDTLEYDQFLIGISKLDSKEVKDLINLTFNLNHFTLCQDVSSYGTIGREYVLNTEGAVPAHDEDDPKYATIGKDLIDRGLAQITERGLLIYRYCNLYHNRYCAHGWRSCVVCCFSQKSRRKQVIPSFFKRGGEQFPPPLFNNIKRRKPV